MKKKTLLSVAVAVMLVAAMAVTAFAAESSVSMSVSQSAVDAGGTFQVTITGTGAGIHGTLNASGATITNVSSELSATNGAFSLLPDEGLTSVTFTLEATGSEGSDITLSISNVTAAGADGAVESISAPGSQTVHINSVTPPTTAPPTETPAPTDSSSPEPSPSDSESPTMSASPSAGASGSARPGATTNPNQDRMPKTGDATMDLWVLAVIAAGCTGAAVVAGKKVFSHK